MVQQTLARQDYPLGQNQILTMRRNATTPNHIRELIEKESGYDLSVESKQGILPTLRKMYAILCHRYTLATYTVIGRTIDRGHATILYHIKEMKFFERDYPEIRELMQFTINEIIRTEARNSFEKAALNVLLEMQRLTA